MFIVLLWIGLAVVIGGIAGARGRSGIGWFLLAVLFSPLIAGLIVAVLPDLRLRAAIERLRSDLPIDDTTLARNVRRARRHI